MRSIWTDEIEAGFLPEILLPGDPRPAKLQIDDRYAHGGGWTDAASTFKIEVQPGGSAKLVSVTYPGDPPLRELSRTHLPKSDELLILFEHDFLAVVQRGGKLEVTRID